MDYVRLGSTGMKVSRICLGCMSYGGPDERWTWALDEEASRASIRHALEKGVNFFDTANVYCDGKSEEYLGRALRDFQSTMAAGSFAWGALAERFGSGTALLLAALTLAGGLAATSRWPLHPVQRLDLSPSGHWTDPKLAITPDPEDGPVLITVEYRVPTVRAGEFIQAMDAMRIFRRREGAVSWGIFRDLADPERYVETFLVPTWAEHMRQHARVTVEDQAIEAHTFSFKQPGVEPFATHLIAARTYDYRTPTKPPYAELS